MFLFESALIGELFLVPLLFQSPSLWQNLASDYPRLPPRSLRVVLYLFKCYNRCQNRKGAGSVKHF